MDLRRYLQPLEFPAGQGGNKPRGGKILQPGLRERVQFVQELGGQGGEDSSAAGFARAGRRRQPSS